MTIDKELIYTIALSELRAGKQASEIGNIGQARVCARRACGMAIEYWLKSNSYKDWGASAITMLNKLQEDYSIPKYIRDAAYRLTKRADKNFETGVEEDPLKDGEMIVKYFLDSLQSGE